MVAQPQNREQDSGWGYPLLLFREPRRDEVFVFLGLGFFLGWSVGWLVGWLVGRLVGWSVGRLVS